MSFKYGVAVPGFTFGLVSSIDGTAITSGTIVSRISKDGGAQASITDTAAHLGEGQWSIDLSATEMQAAVLGLVFGESTTPAVPAHFTIQVSAKIVSDLNDTDLTAAVADVPTVAELNARTLVAAEYFDPSVDTVTTVTTVTNQVSADMTSISGGTLAADNLEAMYDGTGYIDDTAPASRSQVSNLSTGSAAISTRAGAGRITTGINGAGDYTDTFTPDGAYYQVEDDNGAMILELDYSVGGAGVGVTFSLFGYLDGNGDTVNIEAYNFDLVAWESIGSIDDAASDVLYDFNLDIGHTDTDGSILIRTNGGALSAATLYIDHAYVSYSIVSQSVGYAGGMIWINTNSGVPGVEGYVNGTADNPCLTWADAITLNTALNLNRFMFSSDSTVTLTASADSFELNGDGATLLLNNQSISSTIIRGMTVSGSFTAVAGGPVFHTCKTDLDNIHPASFISSGFSGATAVLVLAGDVFVIDCFSMLAGAASPSLSLGAAISGSNILMRRFGGGCAFTDISAGDTVSADATVGGTLTIDGTGGNVEMRGGWEALNDLSAGSVTIERSAAYSDIARINGSATPVSNLEDNFDGTGYTHDTAPATQLQTTQLATQIGTAGAGLTDLGGMSTAMKAQVNAEADAAIIDYDPPTNAELEIRTPSAEQLAYITANSATGLPVTFTTAGSSTTAAVLNLVDGGAGSATDDQYNGRLLVFTDGTLKGVVTDITDYTGSTTTATITALPVAVTSSHNARLI